MNLYELTIVLPEKSTPAKKKSVSETIEKIAKVNGGKIAKSDDWGEKGFAYPISKNNSGSYLYFELELEASSVKSLNDKIKLEDGILRHLLVNKNSK